MERPDHIYVISLKRANRTQEAIKELAAQGIYDAEIMYAIDCLEEGPAFGLKGYQASALTHQMVYRDIVTKGYKRALILEDDALFEGNFWQQFDALQEPADWGMFYLGGTKVTPIGALSGGVIKIDHILCGHAYMIRGETLQAAIDIIPVRPTEPHDCYLCELQKTHATYVAIPFLIIQRPGFSSIENRYMDYVDYMRNESKKIENILL